MKRFVVWFLGMAAACTWGATPLALSLGGATFPKKSEVYGLHLSPFLIGEGPQSVTGVSLGVVNSHVEEEVWGIQAAGLFSGFGRTEQGELGYVHGIQLSGFWAGVDNLQGIQVAGFMSGTEKMAGLQAGGVFAFAGHEATGLQAAGIFSIANELRGVQFAGLISQADECRGLQVAFWTACPSMCGVQVGVMNYAIPAEDGWVVQIGLINGIGRDKWASRWFEGTRYCPGINIGW